MLGRKWKPSYLPKAGSGSGEPTSPITPGDKDDVVMDDEQLKGAEKRKGEEGSSAQDGKKKDNEKPNEGNKRKKRQKQQELSTKGEIFRIYMSYSS
jgi:hypothetical protein